MNSRPQRVWFITGTSSGFGRSMTEAVLASGDLLAATVRQPQALNDLKQQYEAQLQVLPLDVTDAGQAQDAIKAAIQRFGKLDIVVNNAGYGLFGALEMLSLDDIHKQFETNVFGVVNVTKAVLPYFRNQRKGHIFMISSIGGQIGAPGLSAYQGTKFALEGISEALAKEVDHLGIKVTIIEPGDLRTNWAGGSMKRVPSLEDYEPSVGLVRNHLDAVNGHQPGDPARAAQVIISLAGRADLPLRLPLGLDALQAIRQKLTAQLQDLETWRATTISTMFPDQS